MKKFTTANFANYIKYHTPFSQICEKHNLTEEELELAIRNVYHSKRADEVIRTLRGYDEQAAKQARKQKDPVPVIPEAIIVVDEINDDNVADVVAAVEEVFAENSKTELELLQERRSSLNDQLSESERELEKLYGIQAEINQKVHTLVEEVRELKTTIEQKIAVVGELKDYSSEVDQQIAAAIADSEAIKNELAETEAAIKVAQVVTITVLADGWFKFEPKTIKIPNAEVSSDELSEIFSTFILDPQFETISRKDIRQLVTLDKMIQKLRMEHTNIEVHFEDDVLGGAWNTWKQD